MKKAVLIALGLVAGAVIYVLVTDPSRKDIWDSVLDDQI
jgi:hypothetical protein